MRTAVFRITEDHPTQETVAARPAVARIVRSATLGNRDRVSFERRTVFTDKRSTESSLASSGNGVPVIRRSVIANSSDEQISTVVDNAREVVMPAPYADGAELTVLVVNSSQEMAKEITLQLTLAIPGCSITYAPTIALAQWILSRRKIGLVVSSPVLPDGGIGRLKDALSKIDSPPDVVVVGDMRLKNADLLSDSGYEFAVLRRLASGRTQSDAATPRIVRRNVSVGEGGADGAAPVQTRISSLGADIRNDLNNPLQEIVAMVFVAQASGAVSAGASSALGAIEAAAKNMAKVVNSLEDKIRTVVSV